MIRVIENPTVGNGTAYTVDSPVEAVEQFLLEKYNLKVKEWFEKDLPNGNTYFCTIINGGKNRRTIIARDDFGNAKGFEVWF